VVALGLSYQHPPCPQEVDEGIPAHLDPLLGERPPELVVELAGAQPFSRPLYT
jgi:hypothetical protein